MKTITKSTGGKILLVIIAALLLLLPGNMVVSAEPTRISQIPTVSISQTASSWLPDYGNRKSLTITGSTDGAQTNYQLKLTVHKGSGTDSGPDVYLNNHCKDDFSDIRFTKSDGTALLDYWIESSVSGTSAVVWIEFDAIPAHPDGGTFYIYYNYAAAMSASSGPDTFIYFEDFDYIGDISGQGEWTTTLGSGDSATCSGGVLSLYDDGSEGECSINHTEPTGGVDDFRIYVSVKTSSYNSNKYFRFYSDDHDLYFFNGYGRTGWYSGAREMSGSGYATTYNGTTWAKDAWHQNIFTYHLTPSPATVEWIEDGTTIATQYSDHSSSVTALIKITGSGEGGAGTTYWDKIFFTKFAANEPTFTGWGTEESSPSVSPSWLENYTNRKSLTITGSHDGAQTNYQLKLTVHKGSGTDSGPDVYLNNHCKDDFSDIRFTKSDGTTLLDYWIESSVSGTSAVVWIEFDAIPASPSTVNFYLYYNNPSAASASDGANTFIFFDNFERGANGGNVDGVWNISGSPTPTISTARAFEGTRSVRIIEPSGTFISGIYIPHTFTMHDAVYIRSYLNSTANDSWDVIAGNATKFACVMNWGYDIRYWDGSRHDTGADLTLNAWHLFELRNFNFSTCTYDIYYDNFLVKSATPMCSGSNPYLVINSQATSTHETYHDVVIIRNFTTNEPTFTGWGTEESSPSGGPSWLANYANRKSLTITGSSDGAQTNYQLKLTVHKGTGTDSGSDVYLGNKVKADFSDIRFTKSDGTTLLDYWIESCVSGTSAIVWVEFDSIPASPSTANFYIYYHYANATSVSNIDNTFIFGDDFRTETTLDTGKWTPYGTSTQTFNGTDGIAISTNITYSGIRKNSTISFSTTKKIITTMKFSTNTYDYGTSIMLLPTSSSNPWFEPDLARLCFGGAVVYREIQKKVFPAAAVSIANAGAGGGRLDVFGVEEIDFKPGAPGVYRYVNDGTQVYSNTAESLFTPTDLYLYIEVDALAGTRTGTYKYIAVANYTTSEPTFTGWGIEESSPSGSPSWLANYGYRKSLMINGTTAGAQSNYQLKLTIYKGTGTDNGNNVYLGGHCKADFSDIRFAKSDGTSLLDYWVESCVENTSAIVWVEFDSIPANPSTTNFYLYYGNAAASNSSNGNNTFIFFDDFSGSTVDSSKWITTIAGTYNTGSGATIDNGKLRIAARSVSYSSNSYVDVRSVDSFNIATTPIMVHYYADPHVSSGEGRWWHGGFFFAAESSIPLTNRDYPTDGLRIAECQYDYWSYTPDMQIDQSINGNHTNMNTTNNFSGNHTYDAYINATTLKVNVNGLPVNLLNNGTWNSTYTSFYIYFHRDADQDILTSQKFDNLYVCKYVSPEPVISAWGAEETNNQSPAPQLSVSTIDATEVSDNRARMNGNLTDMGPYNSVQVRFKFGLTPAVLNETSTHPMNTTGSFSYGLGNLTANTTYYSQAVAYGENETVYGEVLSFRTQTGTSSGVSVSLNAPARVAPNANFTVSVDIANVTTFDSVNYDITFNPAVLRLDGVTAGVINGTTIPVDISTQVNPGDCIIVQNVPGVSGVSGSGQLALLHFRSIGAAGTTGAIGISNGVLSNIQAQEIIATWSGDTVEISALPGDANDDGRVNAIDITKVERIIARLDSATTGADANQDGKINAVDITKIERLIAGLP